MWCTKKKTVVNPLKEDEPCYVLRKGLPVVEMVKPKISPITFDEVLQVMTDGGERLCDEAITKWRSGQYGINKDMTNEYIARWKRIRDLIGDIARGHKRR